MRFRLTSSSMTLMSLNCISSNFSENFAGFCRSGTQQQLNESYRQRKRCNTLNVLFSIMFLALIAIATCPSVRPSVTRRYCVKTKKAIASRVTISSPSASSMILVFWRQISSPNSKGFPPNGASKKGGVWKFSDFLALSVNISKTVADTAKVTSSD